VEPDYLRLAVDTLDDHKGLDILVLDLRRLSDATDYFLVASGSSDVHVRALAEHVEQALEQAGRRAHHVEGVRAGRWALLDYFDFVVHIFHPTLRQFYQLERLWADAPTTRAGAD
jgi:ribosome-associated protein